ncbi:MAG: DUF3021 domain-containing protein [Oscillospiraceae bacterium]|nr:DUF3021 domain-containing protein [Oscillospiraceae bacterium]
MKKYVVEFLKRGLMACWGGPVIIAIIYLCLNASGAAETITLTEAAKNILTITLMAFVASGITMVYQIEKLALFPALLLHGAVLYLDYIMIYLTNGWLAEGITPFLVFTVVFVLSYALIWVIIYLITKNKTQKINQVLNS